MKKSWNVTTDYCAPTRLNNKVFSYAARVNDDKVLFKDIIGTSFCVDEDEFKCGQSYDYESSDEDNYDCERLSRLLNASEEIALDQMGTEIFGYKKGSVRQMTLNW